MSSASLRKLPGGADSAGSLGAAVDRDQQAADREHVTLGADHQRPVDRAAAAGELRTRLGAQPDLPGGLLVAPEDQRVPGVRATGIHSRSMEAAAADPAFAQLVRAMNAQAKLLRSWPLAGGVSAQVTALETRLPGGRREKLVVRQYGAANLAADPHAAAGEAELLGVLWAAGLPVPRPRHVDESGRILPGPYLVQDFVEGAALRDPPAAPPDTARQLAAVLAAIHRVRWPRAGPPFLRDKAAMFTARLAARPAALDEPLSEGRIRAALARAWPCALRNEPVLLHGDFWPGNTLWRDGRLAAIIDWEDAGCGDPLADLANGRLEMTMLLGAPAMREFTWHYRAQMGSLDYASLPVWDLCAALRPAGKLASWELGPATLSRLRRGHREFTGQALAALPG